MSFKFLLMIIVLIAMTLVSFLEESFSQSTSFEKHVVTSSFTEGTEVFSIDINQDGLMDFVSSGNGDGGQVVWWENNGYHEFVKHQVDNNLLRARSVCAADLNDDGEIDILAAAWEGGTITWYENDGEENWTKHFVDSDFAGAHTVDIKDVNQDGKPDVLCSQFDMSAADSEIAWFENDLPNTSWTRHVISTRFKQSPFIYGEDMDGDTDIDILACGELNGEVFWWENDGSQNWTEHMIDDQFDMAHTVFIRDIDLDGDMDVIGAACMDSRLAWWENDGSQNFTKHFMGTLAGALWFDAADLDNDGDNDLYAGGQGATKLVWWENDGNADFTKYEFDEGFSQTFALVHADFDNDSDNDLVAIGYMNDQIAWFENNFIQPNLYDKPECVVYDQLYDRYIVSNINNGSLVETDTSNNSNYWIHGYGILYGMCIGEGILYTSDGDTLFGFHLATGNEVLAMAIPNNNNLDGMTIDGNGFLYVIDTWGRIIKVDLDAETYEVLVPSGLPNWPQDCVFDPFENRIVVAAYAADAPIVGVDPETGEVTTLTTNSVGRYDGITIDQYGNFYLASHNGSGQVYKYSHDFSNKTMIAWGLGEPTGLNYNQQDNILAVPSFDQHAVYFYPMNPVGMAEQKTGHTIEFEVYPNPAKDKFGVRSAEFGIDPFQIGLFSPSGNLIKEQYHGNLNSNQILIDVSDLAPGMYFVKMRSKDAVGVKKLVVR